VLPKEGAGRKGAGRIDPAHRSAAADKLAMEQTLGAVLVQRQAEDSCGLLVTDTWVKDVYGSVTACRREQHQGGNATQLSFGDPTIIHGTARMTVQVEGGPFAGQGIFDFVLKDGVWKLDARE
jgi:hypothetical protein